jgi:hypothetical protein
VVVTSVGSFSENLLAKADIYNGFLYVSSDV